MTNACAYYFNAFALISIRAICIVGIHVMDYNECNAQVEISFREQERVRERGIYMQVQRPINRMCLYEYGKVTKRINIADKPPRSSDKIASLCSAKNDHKIHDRYVCFHYDLWCSVIVVGCKARQAGSLKCLVKYTKVQLT